MILCMYLCMCTPHLVGVLLGIKRGEMCEVIWMNRLHILCSANIFSVMSLLAFIINGH